MPSPQHYSGFNYLPSAIRFIEVVFLDLPSLNFQSRNRVRPRITDQDSLPMIPDPVRYPTRLVVSANLKTSSLKWSSFQNDHWYSVDSGPATLCNLTTIHKVFNARVFLIWYRISKDRILGLSTPGKRLAFLLKTETFYLEHRR